MTKMVDKERTIGRIIEKLRKERGISQTKLASLSGVSTAYVNRIESDDRTNVSEKKLDNIFDSLNVSVQDVLSSFDYFFEKSNKASDTYLSDIVRYLNDNEIKFDNQVIDDMKKEALIDLIRKINDDSICVSEIISVVEEYQSL